MLMVGATRNNPSVYEKEHLGQTAEERLLDMTRRARIGPAEGEPGVTRVESSTSNGVQVRALRRRCLVAV